MGYRSSVFIVTEQKLLDTFRQKAKTRLINLIQKTTDVKFYNPSATDAWQVLRLEELEERFQLAAKEWLPQLVAYYRQGRKGRFQGLGVKLTTLFGHASEQWLTKFIEREYPDGENRIAWKATRQKATVRRREIGLDTEDYVKEIDRRRTVLARQQETRKPYRGSPWI